MVILRISFVYTKYQFCRELETLDRPVFMSHQFVKPRLVVRSHAPLLTSQGVYREGDEQMVGIDGIQQPQLGVYVYLFETRYSLEHKGQVDLEGGTVLQHITCLGIARH